MKKLIILTLTLIMVISLAACGEDPTQGMDTVPPTADSGASGSAPAATATVEVVPTATRFALATSTPLPPPPTPTVVPPTATPETAAAEPAEPAGPAVTDVMIEIPAGPFTMGSDSGDPEEAPVHEVDLPAFEIDKFEVTNADFSTFIDETGYVPYAEAQGLSGGWRDEWGMGEDSHPVSAVTWDDAVAYCTWLGKRLPAEAEWEKAARGDDGRSFPWGNEWDFNKANVKERGLRGTAAVGSFADGASPYGVEDMTGNVWEWTADWYQAYPGNSVADPYFGEKIRVTRGGGWFDEETQSTTFNRNAADPTKTINNELGFRCAR